MYASERGGNNVAQKFIDIRVDAPTELDGGIGQRRLVLQNDAKFAQSLRFIALDQVEVGGFPGYVWSGGIGLMACSNASV